MLASSSRNPEKASLRPFPTKKCLIINAESFTLEQSQSGGGEGVG